MPPLTTVDPPTQRPSAYTIGARPTMADAPALRYRVRSASPVAEVNVSVG